MNLGRDKALSGHSRALLCSVSLSGVLKIAASPPGISGLCQSALILSGFSKLFGILKASVTFQILVDVCVSSEVLNWEESGHRETWSASVKCETS